MMYNSRVGSYDYDPDHPHAVLHAGTNSYTYDDNGNMTGGEVRTFVWDYDNRPTSINGITMVYDYKGQRVKKGSTKYIDKFYECTGSNCTMYIFGGRSRIAKKNGTSINYYHPDHLGGSSVVSGDSMAKAEEINYYPFGETRTDTGSVNVRHKFTGQEWDSETGLYCYGARYYHPVIGRFISADTFVPQPYDPQSLNRYSYARNNPMKLVDPTGHAPTIPYHRNRTYDIATNQVGFTEDVATRIARADMAVDVYPWMSFLPLIGNQGNHFNMNISDDGRPIGSGTPEDTRWQNGMKYWGQAKENLANCNIEAADIKVGYMLHPLAQDMETHTDAFVSYGMVLGNWYPWHPQGDNNLNNPDNRESNPEGYFRADARTFSILETYYQRRIDAVARCGDSSDAATGNAAQANYSQQYIYPVTAPVFSPGYDPGGYSIYDE